MKIAIFGGTHGNEPVGVEVMKALKENRPKDCIHEYECFIGNPEAYKIQKRFVDSDLNRAFGKNASPTGYEYKRAKELEEQVRGKFDLILDLHTTTTNMGLVTILNNTHDITRQACMYLKSKNSEIKLVEEDLLDEDCTHLNRLAPAGITIEVGPVANNVVAGDLVLKTYKMVEAILAWDFERYFDYKSTERFKVTEIIEYPKEKGWYIHPERENQDFRALHPGEPIFINIGGDIKTYEGDEVVYPFFINEAAYQKNEVAMVLSELVYS